MGTFGFVPSFFHYSFFSVWHFISRCIFSSIFLPFVLILPLSLFLSSISSPIIYCYYQTRDQQKQASPRTSRLGEVTENWKMGIEAAKKQFMKVYGVIAWLICGSRHSRNESAC